MSSTSPGRDRAVRIELLRARAVIERQSIAHGVQQLGESLTPRGLLESFLPGGGGGGGRRRVSPSDMLTRVFGLSRRYPMILSMGTALVSSAARRRMRWWKLALGAAVAWKVSRRRR